MIQSIGFRPAQIMIGGKTVASYAVPDNSPATLPNNRRQTNRADTADISPIARALAQSAVTQSEKYGNPELTGKGRHIIPVRGQSNEPDNWDDLRKGKMRSLDRFLDQPVGTSYGAMKKARENGGDGTKAGDRPEIFAENVIYGMMSAKAESERDAIQHDMKKLLKERGIDVKDTTGFSLSISKNGAIEVDSVSLNLESAGQRGTVEEILNSDKDLALRMVKNSAMFKLQDPRYDDSGASASRAEMALVNIELQERFGFGLDKLGEVGVGNIWGFNRGLDAAMAKDELFEMQVFTYAGSTAEFDVQWDFGNGRVADKTNSARSFLPRQWTGSFAEKLQTDPKTAGSEIKFTLTPDGRSKVIDASAGSARQEYTDGDREYAMNAMEGVLSEAAGNGGLEPLKEAAKRAIEEHLVKNGGSEENLEAVVTARNGRWSIEVEEKGIVVELPEEKEGEVA